LLLTEGIIMDNEEVYQLPVDHPRLAAVCGVVYAVVFEPINKAIDWLSSQYTTKFIRDNSDPEDLK
jgi:hypothetical protein